MNPIVLAVLVSASTPTVQQQGPLLRDSWVNRASFFVGMRGGLAIPPGASSLAPNVSLEMGVAPSRGFGIGMRAMWMSQPPGVPFLGLNAGNYGFGAMADLRFYVETIEPLTIYPTIAVGFLAGPDAITGRNLVLPLFNPGLGAKLRFGNFYVGFEFGVSGFTIPFMAVTAGYQGDSKMDKQRTRLEQAGLIVDGEEVPRPPVVAPVQPVQPVQPPASEPQSEKAPQRAPLARNALASEFGP